jgi:Acyl-CoA reductase (LuxC)
MDFLLYLANYLNDPDDRLAKAMHDSHFKNQWFTMENQQFAIDSIRKEMLTEYNLKNWLSHYPTLPSETPQKVGLIMAGNLPLVGFHDWLCVMLAGHTAIVKLSEKDSFLLPLFIAVIAEKYPEAAARTVFTERLNDINAVIATGSTNTSRYFEQYFGKYPNIIRKSRTSVAVFDGTEDTDTLHEFGKDVFRYFGLGCRNVSKVYVPRGYDFEPLLEQLHEYNEIIHHNKYKNNFDYNFTLVIINRVHHLNNGCTIMTEDKALHSRIAMLHYEYYDDINTLSAALSAQKEEIQCVVSNLKIADFPIIPFGKTQEPTLKDYADGVDTMAFLAQINPVSANP